MRSSIAEKASHAAPIFTIVKKNGQITIRSDMMNETAGELEGGSAPQKRMLNTSVKSKKKYDQSCEFSLASQRSDLNMSYQVMKTECNDEE